MSGKLTSWSKTSQENTHRRCPLQSRMRIWLWEASRCICVCVQLYIRTEEVKKKPIQAMDKKKKSNFRVLST